MRKSKIEFMGEPYKTCVWLRAFLVKDRWAEYVLIGLPNLAWKGAFEAYAKSLGVEVRWDMSLRRSCPPKNYYYVKVPVSFLRYWRFR